MAAQLATRCRIKQKRRHLRRRASGRTVYAYVSSNPISNIDPLGLVDWNVGTWQINVGKGLFGAGTGRFTATSECVDGKFAVVSGVFSIAGAGFSVPGVQGATSKFYDGNSKIDPSVFNGGYVSLSVSASIGGGIGYSATRIGDVKSDFSFGAVGGIGGGTSADFGAAETTGANFYKCGCSK